MNQVKGAAVQTSADDPAAVTSRQTDDPQPDTGRSSRTAVSAARILRGSGSNVVRLVFTSLVALALPLFLTRTLSTDEYGAWVTLLQISTYVALLDLGLQVVVARFVAEHESRGDGVGAIRTVTTGVRVLLVGALVGSIGVLAASGAVSTLFPEMPATLRPQAGLALVLVGLSSAVALPFGPFLAAFTGLQRYGFPVMVAIASKTLAAVAVVAAASLGGGLVGMAAALAAVNGLTVLAQFTGWRRLVRPLLSTQRVRPDAATVRLLLSTGGLIALWSVGGLLVNGLDTVIVGHFDFRAVGAFAVATTAVNFLLQFLNSLFSPLMPAAAALQGPDARDRVQALAIRATRYSTLLIVVLGALLCVFATPLLTIWVGSDYAEIGAPLLRLLVLGNAVRQLAYVYSLVVVARGQQKPATIATMAEAIVNIIVSVALASTLGAAGVAIGTVAGSAVSVLLHLSVSMRYTRSVIPISRTRFLARGIGRPLLTAVPLLVILPVFNGAAVIPAPPIVLAPALMAFAVAVPLLGLDRHERRQVRTICRSPMRRFVTPGSARG